MRGMYAPAGNMTGFTGTLVGRRYQPGQKYIQLVFKTTEGLKLSLSRNLNMVRSLRVGLTYWVEGPEISLKQKTYIHEPIATLVQPTTSLFKRYRIIFATTAVVIVLGAAGSVLALKKDSTPSASQSQTPAAATGEAVTPQTKDTTDTTPTSTEQDQLGARAPSTTSAPTKKTPAKSTPAAAAASPTPASSNSPTPQPAAPAATDNQAQPVADPTPPSEPAPTPPPAIPDPGGDTL
jgi:hypothetical protein